jgi:RNA polymerase sigma factor (sigma-70 family)
MAEVAVEMTCACVGEDEVAELFGALAGSLRRIVAAQVTAPEAVIEDACQFAWSTLVRHPGWVRRETALGWLARTAMHEALKLIRVERRELSLDELSERISPDRPAPWALAPSVEEQVEQRARLASLEALPERQQRVIWLQGLGFSYTEMAGHTGSSRRTVERQLMRAKRTLRETEWVSGREARSTGFSPP